MYFKASGVCNKLVAAPQSTENNKTPVSTKEGPDILKTRPVIKLLKKKRGQKKKKEIEKAYCDGRYSSREPAV